MKIRQLFHRITALLCAAALTAGIPSAGAMAAYTRVTVKKPQQGLQFTLTGMPYNGAYSPLSTYNGESFTVRSVQNFAFSPDNRYIFTVSEGYSGAESEGKKHTILVCSEIPDTRGSKAISTYVDCTVLGNFGHGETLAVTSSATAGAYDVWVACNPNSIKTQRFGMDIARLTCKINKGQLKIKKRVTLSFNGVRPYNQNISRDRLGVAVNQGANKIAFRIHTAGNGSFYQVYDFKKLNKLLNKTAKNGTLQMTSTAVKKLLQADIKCNQIPTGTFQSFDVDGGYLYICGGHMDKGAQIFKIKYTASPNGTARPQACEGGNITQVIDITPKILVRPSANPNPVTLGKAELEIEGMKIQNIRNSSKVNYYINFFMKDTPITDTIGIYKFKK